DSYWENLLWNTSGTGRRLGNTKLNFYLNYWYGTADAASIQSLMDNLQKHGVMWIQTANCFSQYPADNTFSVNNSDAFVQTIGSHPGLGGYYVADECIPAMLQGVFSQDLRV